MTTRPTIIISTVRFSRIFVFFLFLLFHWLIVCDDDDDDKDDSVTIKTKLCVNLLWMNIDWCDALVICVCVCVCVKIDIWRVFVSIEGQRSTSSITFLSGMSLIVTKTKFTTHLSNEQRRHSHIIISNVDYFIIITKSVGIFFVFFLLLSRHE